MFSGFISMAVARLKDMTNTITRKLCFELTYIKEMKGREGSFECQGTLEARTKLVLAIPKPLCYPGMLLTLAAFHRPAKHLPLSGLKYTRQDFVLVWK